MPPRLIAVGGPLSGATLLLTDAKTSVGRGDANTLALADPSVSPSHCVFAWDGRSVTLSDLDRSNPSFVNGLPTGDGTLEDGDQIQIGGSLFVLKTSDDQDDQAIAENSVTVEQRGGPEACTILMRREDVFGPDHPGPGRSRERLSRDLAALIRISAAISAIRGLVALERPLIALIAEVLPASRGAVVLSGERPTDIASAIGWRRDSGAGQLMQLNRSVVESVLRDTVGVLSHESWDGDIAAAKPRSVLAAPLVAFDKLIGAIVMEADGPDGRFDEGHLRLLMAIAGIAATALEHARLSDAFEGTNRRLRAELNLDHNMVGESPTMRDVYHRIARVAPTDSTVLITGESGTGKELVARAIHRNSPRSEHPFVAINCAAITESLLESELFGHEKGAFTGAIAQKKGKLEVANGGTVFLDEIGELSCAIQAKLLRVLQNREFERVGGTRTVRVDFRLLAATNRDLEAAIGAGLFRRDLYYRVNVVSLIVPPLRERREDIPLLASWFVRRHGDKANRLIAGFSAEALACLTTYDWPGNVRELENAVEQAAVLGLDALILPDDLPDAIAEAGASAPIAGAPATLRFHETIKQAKKNLIVEAVEKAGGNYNAAARLLGLHPNYLHRLIKNLQLKSTVTIRAER